MGPGIEDGDTWDTNKATNKIYICLTYNNKKTVWARLLFFGDEIFQMIPNNVRVGVSLGPAKELLHVPVHFDGEYPHACDKGSKKRCAQGSSKKQSRKDCRLILVKLTISSSFHFL